LLDQREVAPAGSWAHLAVAGDEIHVREINGLSVFRWKAKAE
jgi:hypothetical protein